MRKFRTAAVAAATAAAVSFTGITAASAQEAHHQNSNSSSADGSSVLSPQRGRQVLSSDDSDQVPTRASQFGELMNAGEDVSGTGVVGNRKGSRDDNGEITIPGWARLGRDGSLVAALGTVVDGAIAAYN